MTICFWAEFFNDCVVCLSSSVVVCRRHLSSVTHVLWLNVRSYQKTYYMANYRGATALCVQNFSNRVQGEHI